jgi:hypothetical protein
MEGKKIRIRVKELKMVPADQLIPSEKNFRRHTDEQRNALNGMLEEVGFAGAIVTRKLDDGRYEIIDGHLRADVGGDEEVPIIVTDLDDTEAAKILATYDAIGGMAEIDNNVLRNLTSEIDFQSRSIDDLINKLIDSDISSPENLPEINIETEIKPEFKVIIQCADEKQQKELLDRFNKEGLICQALML